MIPVKLTMRNFMCYRDDVPPLYFDSIHLACLSGDNGNGKSALIDAMTWALWGKARATSDDDLVYSGQTEMGVEFEFRIGQQLYCVIRKRSKPKRQRSAGQSILELQTSTEDGFKPITGNIISQTQKKITEDILHMDYETFINSAYLRQGHDNEFTVKQPVERKKVLGEILRLSLYDELETKAKEQAKQQETEKAGIETTIKDISGELARKSDYEAEFELVRGELSGIETAIGEKESYLNELRQKKQEIEQKKAQLQQIEGDIKKTEKDLAQWDDQLKQNRSRLQGYEELIAQRSDIEAGYTRLTETRKLSEELNQKFRTMTNIKERKYDLENYINGARQEILKNHEFTQNKISELEAEQQKLPGLNNQLCQARIKLNQLAGRKDTLDRKKQTLQDLQTKVNQLKSDKTRLEVEKKDIEEKLRLISTQQETTCPLCETELTRQGLKHIEAKYISESNEKSDLLKSNQASLTSNKPEIESLINETNQLESSLSREKADLRGKIVIFNNGITKVRDAEKQLTEKRKELAEIEQHLAGKDFAATEQAALNALEDELDRLDYNEESNQQVRQQLADSEHYVNSKHRLDEADKLVRQEGENVSRAETASQELSGSLETLDQNKQELTTELNAFPTRNNDLEEAQIEQQKKTLVKERDKVQETIGSLKNNLQRITEHEKKKKDMENQLSQATEQENIYKELAKAFGKGGIQTLIIEKALPEIETEANFLLGRMTDNRMQLKFETRRETKKGDLVDTLDIIISDELGTRNYEMFSGGEAFRINFAIRIALSKLLAKRAGAPLPTLIIDEGFGTQDSTGIEKLKEAINSIQDDFDKIFVVTHIEELRDAFPTRIDVIKTAEGSTLAVN